MTIPARADLIHLLPYARRYARALTGSQAEGDALVATSLKQVVAGAAEAAQGEAPRVVLYRAITRNRLPAHGERASVLSDPQRQLLLLTALEEMSLAEAALVVSLPAEQAGALLAEARDSLRASSATDVLIIEDEPIIAMDLEELVTICGHRVIGVAATETDAVAMAARERPGLILADINLGIGGDGTHAVARILRHLDAPVIFVTAYPERLLTGEGPEPPFVITKPFEPITLAIATYQAVTGGVRIV
jgi:CheY-like chemotaxis protein/DNA-directed RNA polymerase specialized sigma24 family protein